MAYRTDSLESRLKGQRRWETALEGCERRMGCIARVAFFDYWSFETFRRDAIRKSRAGKSQGNKRLSFINVPSECIIQARWIYNHSHFEWERWGKSVFNGEWRVSLFHPSDPAPLWIGIRARIRYSSREKAGRWRQVEVNNLSGGFVSVDRVRPGGMSGEGRTAIQYQVSDSVHRFIHPPDTSSSRVEGMEGPSNSKIPAFNTIQSSWTSPREGVSSRLSDA